MAEELGQSLRKVKLKSQAYYARPCGCSYAKCSDWHVSNVADVQGVHFTKRQARKVAKVLNEMEGRRAR
jgi:hypothetical protein